MKAPDFRYACCRHNGFEGVLRALCQRSLSHSGDQVLWRTVMRMASRSPRVRSWRVTERATTKRSTEGSQIKQMTCPFLQTVVLWLAEMREIFGSPLLHEVWLYSSLFRPFMSFCPVIKVRGTKFAMRWRHDFVPCAHLAKYDAGTGIEIAILMEF